ncbi:hypothetical protein [Microbacterium sp. T2.11-28]|uniref:hypothetical protein n=1 Tax=Microbacterium sp. T2.11-28 TaxID=3041169 RepID=UPI0024776D80|nr:hypothetical protein [Microbacterium sp. T2.11-28]CAI9386053.1 hypothetical protein MICABA_00147 [Microbacterium sp. T2.11-28]
MPSAPHTPALRRLSAADAPLPGDLLPAATSPPGGEAGNPSRQDALPGVAEPVVWTEASLWDDNPAWRADPGGHVLAPIDAAMGPDGAGLLVPHCPLRLRAWLDRRAGVEAGEAVTTAVSILRGGAEADALAALHGTWWVTSAGKPVLALGGAALWRTESDALLERLTEDAPPALSAALRTARSVLTDPRRLRREAEAAEASLFAAADPGPLEIAAVPPDVRPQPLTVLPPGSTRAGSAAHGSEVRGAVRGAARGAARSVDVPSAAPRDSAGAVALRSALRRHLDAEWGDRLADAWSRLVRRRPHSPPRDGHRRRALGLAAGAGAAVLAVGIWLPAPQPSADGAAPRSSETPSSAPSPTAEPPAPRRGAEEAPRAEEDLTAVGEELLRRFAACAAAGCPASVVVTPGRDFPSGAATAPSVDRTVTLLDEYGGAASLRVTADEDDRHPSQIVVIVRDEDEWLVRDVYDVADQP